MDGSAPSGAKTKYQYASYHIVHSNACGAAPVVPGWLIIDAAGCNAAPGATYFETPELAQRGVDCIVASDGDGRRFWALWRLFSWRGRATMPIHAKDEDCVLDPDDVCMVCLVFHGDPCPRCEGRGFHRGWCKDGWPAATTPEGAVTRIIADLCDRRGLKHEWALIDPKIQEEIRAAWTALVRPVAVRGPSP